MLPAKNSLKSKQDFDLVKQKGKLENSNSFGLSYYKRGDSNPSRFGFIISTKIDKRATLRNRAKRAFRHAVRQRLSLIKDGYDCVFLAKPIIVKIYTDEIMKEVGEVLKKANLLK